MLASRALLAAVLALNALRVAAEPPECEGFARYDPASRVLDLPLVTAGEQSYAAQLELLPTDPPGFALRQAALTESNPWPLRPPCPARLERAGETWRLTLPLVGAPGADALYRAELAYRADGSFALESAQALTRARLEPVNGVYFGVGFDWAVQSAGGFSTALGLTPNVFVRHSQLPLDAQEQIWVEQAVQQVAAVGGTLLFTLEPHGGLGAVDEAAAQALAALLRHYNDDLGVPVLVNFAPDMNGAWFAWAQQPGAYIAAFRRVAAAVHQHTTASAMLWAPAYGAGYPFGGQPSAADLAALDSQGDGRLDAADDSYAPYYPGDDAVDWVGMNLPHWGNVYPWGENETPEHGKFYQQLRGEYVGLNGDQRSLPDFYGIYAEAKHKPLAIPSTAALFVPAQSTDPSQEFLIKQLWWREVFSADTRERLPQVKLIAWQEVSGPEAEAGGQVVDWRISHDGALAQAFSLDLRRAWVGIFSPPP